MKPPRKIGAVQINVVDMDAAIAFYELFGFSVNGRNGYPRVVSLRHAGDFFLLLFRVQSSSEVAYPQATRVLLNIETTNLVREIAQLSSQGVEFIHLNPQSFPNGYYAAFRDPSGNIHELVEWKPFDRERRMASNT